MEFALTLSLLAGAGLLARTVMAVSRADAVVQTAHVMFAGISLPPQRYASASERIALYDQLEARVGTIPSIAAAALASGTPFYTAPVWSVTVQGQAFPAGRAGPIASYVVIGSRYFDTLGLRLIRGRPFTDHDGTAGVDTVIVNQLFASRYLPDANPIGQRIRLLDPSQPDDGAPWLTVVGVSPTVRQHYAQEIDAVVYVPYRSNPLANMVLLTRTSFDDRTLTAALREHLRQLDSDLPFFDIRSLDWMLSGTLFANRVFAALFGIAAGLALLLAAVGLHAITTYAVRQRSREIGIRMALGARAGQVVWLFVHRTLGPLAWGVGIGLGAAVGVGRLVQGLLIQTSPRDPLTLISITVVLIIVALVATLRPAYRVTTLNPVSALRYE